MKATPPPKKKKQINENTNKKEWNKLQSFNVVYVFYCNLMQRHLKFSVSPLMSLNSDWSHAPQFFLKPSDRPKNVRSPMRQITTGTMSVGASEVHVNAAKDLISLYHIVSSSI